MKLKGRFVSSSFNHAVMIVVIAPCSLKVIEGENCMSPEYCSVACCDSSLLIENSKGIIVFVIML